MSYRYVDSFLAEPGWTEETCRVSCQNKFVKLMHLVGFIKKKFVTVPGHTKVKYCRFFSASENKNKQN